MNKQYATNLIHQFGHMGIIRNPTLVEAIADRMATHNECVAHAAWVVMAWQVCQCSPCSKARRAGLK